jgi:hypothetical protein
MIVLRRFYNKLATGTIATLSGAGSGATVYEQKEQTPPLLITQKQSTGALLIAPGQTKILSLPQGYIGVTRLSCVMRADNSVRFSILNSNAAASNVLIKGTRTQAGRFAFVDFVTSIAVHNPTITNATVQYTLFEVPDLTLDSSFFGLVPASITPSASGGTNFVATSRVFAGSVRLDYTATPVTNSAWTQLFASVGLAISHIEVFDSSGLAMEIGIGTPGSETRILLVPPGGIGVDETIAANSRISVRAVGGTQADVGELDINLFS